MEGFDRLENIQPETVTHQVNKITELLGSVGGFAFTIKTEGLSSIIEIIAGDLLPQLSALNELALAATSTIVEIDNRKEIGVTIKVSPDPSILQ